jgi:micrococcal nuclease
LAAAPAVARRHPGTPPATIVLDGAATAVRWNDGDSFRILDGPHRGRRARLAGVNALETHGPVHRWGRWTPEELYALARSTAAIAASRPWACAAQGRSDGYRRLLVACPEAAAALVRRGHAMVYAIDGPADPALVAEQRAAQRLGAGMWAKGVPDEIVTSVHSADERELRGRPYDRIADTRSGEARARPHHRTYATCEWVCAASGRGSCMRYVPFERRYRDRPGCLER